MAEPERVGRYHIVAPLRVGGMARVDLARLDGPYGFARHVVVKRPLPHQANDEAALAHIRLEARLLAGIHHPNVIGYLDAGPGYLAIDYVHGVSLRELAPPRGGELARRPSLAAALAIAVEVARGLDGAHDQPGAVVHRDVSPSNVLLGYDGRVVLIDFGVAKLTEGATLSGTLRGKISYMAPEQCKGEAIDRRADVYALGVVLYELVTGRRPFHAADDVASLHKVVSGAAPAAAGVDDELDAVIAKAMAYAPADRHASAGALADALEGYARARGLELGARIVADEVARLGTPRPEPWRSAALAPGSTGASLEGLRHEPAPGEGGRPRPAVRRGGRWTIIAGAAIAAGAAVALVIYARTASPSQAAATSLPAAPADQPPPPPPSMTPIAKDASAAKSVAPVKEVSPEKARAGGDPEKPRAGGDPEKPRAGGDPEKPRAGGDPEKPRAGGDPEKARAAREPERGGEPEKPRAGDERPKRPAQQPAAEPTTTAAPAEPGPATVAAPAKVDAPAPPPVWDPKDSGLPGKRKKKP